MAEIEGKEAVGGVQLMADSARPLLSVIVIGYKMPKQLAQTLYTLSTAYQQGVTEQEYEVVVVENTSSEDFDESILPGLGGNFRFFRRDERSHTPVPAINFAFEQCRGQAIGLMIDGARMVTPRVIQYVLMSQRISPDSFTVVPGYHLGEQGQHFNVSNGYDEEVEQQLLDSTNWKDNGYELFSIADISGANPNGYLQPIMECNCMFASASSFERIGFADERFTFRGGGAINLHMFRSLGMLPASKLIVLPGEGSFHQFHGGVTTSEYDGLERERASHRAQLQELWGGEFHSLRREPVLFGAITPLAQDYLAFSVDRSKKRYKRFKARGDRLWEDDNQLAMEFRK
ncbi:MAG: glycosyltransferase family 2 protein [Gammaproteobacteria bacterium]|nr:MAG: glycosyltransferase family 2 protein [Gammaproteobacteria bacterium]